MSQQDELEELMKLIVSTLWNDKEILKHTLTPLRVANGQLIQLGLHCYTCILQLPKLYWVICDTN